VPFLGKQQVPCQISYRFCRAEGIPKALREALKFLATNDQIDLLKASLQEQLDQATLSSSSTQDAPSFASDLDVEPEVDVNWKEGVEEFQKMSRDDLWNALGLPKGSLPFFNALEDPSGINDPWTPEGREWFQVGGNGKALEIRWHQLVGVLKMLQNAFAGKPSLNMDDVGLGKTIQVTTFIAILAYYRDYYASHGSFPGIFGESFFPPFVTPSLLTLLLKNSKSKGVECRCV
jgi:hypothetical protein